MKLSCSHKALFGTRLGKAPGWGLDLVSRSLHGAMCRPSSFNHPVRPVVYLKYGHMHVLRIDPPAALTWLPTTATTWRICLPACLPACLCSRLSPHSGLSSACIPDAGVEPRVCLRTWAWPYKEGVGSQSWCSLHTSGTRFRGLPTCGDGVRVQTMGSCPMVSVPGRAPTGPAGWVGRPQASQAVLPEVAAW